MVATAAHAPVGRVRSQRQPPCTPVASLRGRRTVVLAASVGAVAWAARGWRDADGGPAAIPATEVPVSWRDVVLPDLRGGVRAVSGARVVNLWARWCAPCRRELPALQRMAQRLQAGDHAVVTIALDDEPFALREYVRDIGLSLPVLLARSASLPAALRPASLPQTLRLDAAGSVRRRVIGARDWDHAAALRELMTDAAA